MEPGMEPHDAEGTDLEISSLDGEPPPNRPDAAATRWLRSWPGRLTLSALCALLMLATLAALLSRSTNNLYGALAASLSGPTPTPTATIPLGGDSFILSDAVPWGALTVDGVAPELSGQDKLGLGFSLPRGRHHLVYQARYFPTLRCLISVPRSCQDICPPDDFSSVIGAGYQRVLDLGGSPQHMTGGQYQALSDIVLTQLSGYTATATIQPGERYYTSTGALATARAPMSFTAGLAPADASDQCPFLCPVTTGLPEVSNVWRLQAMVTPTWVVTDAAGAQTRSLIPLAGSGVGHMELEVIPQSAGWQVIALGPAPLAEMVSSYVTWAFLSDFQKDLANGDLADGRWNSLRATNPADGAAIVIQSSVEAPRPLLLWRFGLILAANANAIQLFPSLSVATPYEQTIARAAASSL